MSSPLLVFRAGSRLGALELSCVEETMRPLPLEHLSGVPECVLGAAIIRGSPTPVLDAGCVLAGERLDAPERLITLRLTGGRAVALLVTGVLGVEQAEVIGEVPPLLQEAAGGAVRALGRLDEEVLTVFRQGRLVPDEVWKRIASEGGHAEPAR